MEKLLRLVRKHDFDPSEIHEMTVAYENVCAAIEDLSPAARQYIAEQIVQLATSGEITSTDLYLKCLAQYRRISDVKKAS
jgi:hypothetical protein